MVLSSVSDLCFELLTVAVFGQVEVWDCYTRLSWTHSSQRCVQPRRSDIALGCRTIMHSGQLSLRRVLLLPLLVEHDRRRCFPV